MSINNVLILTLSSIEYSLLRMITFIIPGNGQNMKRGYEGKIEEKSLIKENSKSETKYEKQSKH